MALNSYLRLEAESQGQIKGSCDQAGREDTIEVIGWSHEVVSPRDAASGMPMGKRQHKPVVVTKAVDKSSPLLMNVLVNNENVMNFRLECWRPSPTGTEQQHYTVELENANISGIRLEQLNNKYPENMSHDTREHISFTYQKIIWTWEDGGITAEDDWKAPVT